MAASVLATSTDAVYNVTNGRLAWQIGQSVQATPLNVWDILDE